MLFTSSKCARFRVKIFGIWFFTPYSRCAWCVKEVNDSSLIFSFSSINIHQFKFPFAWKKKNISDYIKQFFHYKNFHIIFISKIISKFRKYSQYLICLIRKDKHFWSVMSNNSDSWYCYFYEWCTQEKLDNWPLNSLISFEKSYN